MVLSSFYVVLTQIVNKNSEASPLFGASEFFYRAYQILLEIPPFPINTA